MRSLPPLAEDALETLSEDLGHEGGFSEATAIGTLTASGFDEAQAERLVAFLHDAGHLYRVEGTFYFTSPE